jgi:hypothetical protein
LQVEFIKSIWDSLDEEHQEIQSRILQMLQNKLLSIVSQLDKVSKSKVKYVQYKESLDKAIEELAKWQERFDPSRFLIMKISSPMIDHELHRHSNANATLRDASKLRDILKQEPSRKISVFLSADGLDNEKIHEIPFASVKYAQRANSDKWVVMEHRQWEAVDDVQPTIKEVRDLVTKLSSVNPLTFSILQCRGVVKVTDPKSGQLVSFNFAFRIPEGFNSKPQSLRSYLISGQEHTLTDRIQLAKQLARAVCYVHTLEFVHKNIRPETVLGFQSKNSAFGVFFLVGFEKTRLADGRTKKLGDNAWDRNLYRHPHRQGLHPEESYIMQHDIYSLGVCLLEIGLWTTFLSYEDIKKPPKPSHAIGMVLNNREAQDPEMIKEKLVSLAKRELPKRVGNLYEQVVVNCLTCLDKDNIDFGNQKEFEDEDGVLVGVRYIEKVCLL